MNIVVAKCENKNKLVTIGWTFEKPDLTMLYSKMQLLTIGGVCVHGVWSGKVGQYYVAWAPLLPIDHVAFNDALLKSQTTTL